MLSINDFAVVDLFCGIGGLTHGLTKNGFDVAAGIDFDQSCKYSFEKNNNSKFIYKDIVNLEMKELKGLFPEGKRQILVGCAPCQPFSIYNHKNNNNKEEQSKDEKWKLLYSFGRLIEETQPEIVSMENVPLLKSFNNGQVFNDFVSNLERNGYLVSHKIVNAQDYGVPQRRKRLILLASKHGEIELIKPTHNTSNYNTVRKAIGHLEPINGGDISKIDRLHYARKLSELNEKRIKATKEGGSWKDWDESLLLECHKKIGGKSFGSVYGRMKWDDVSPTMTTYCIGLGNGRFGHPQQNRAISLREAAIFQSFPENYEFINPDVPFSSAKIARHIGNAVPVGLGEAIAESIKIHIQNLDE